MKKITLFSGRLFAALLVMVTFTVFSCSNNNSTNTEQIGTTEVVEEPTPIVKETTFTKEVSVPKVTFQGIPIQGNESAIIDSLGKKGFEMEKTQYFDSDFEFTSVKVNAPELCKRISIYQCYPSLQDKDREKDPRYKKICALFLDGELWRINVTLSYKHLPALGDIAIEFGKKYSTTMKESEGSYITTLGNTQVSIRGFSYYGNYRGSSFNSNEVIFDYKNLAIDSKVYAGIKREKSEKVKKDMDML